MKNEILKSQNIFESIKHIDEDGKEYWYARELMISLKYAKWENFKKIIIKAIITCENSGISAKVCFPDIRKPIVTGRGREELIEDYKLTRYACYLIAQNGDPRKEVIALAQTYFAIQTRKQEILENDYNQLTEDEKRIQKRSRIRKANNSLNQAAKTSGVKNFDKFHNYGYKGLYNGETADDIAKRKKLRYREEILDNMGSDELTVNEFRITLTNQKLRNEKIKGEKNADLAHYDVGKNIREVIIKSGGTTPENLPTPEKSLKQLEKEKKQKKLSS